jgi:hypothetical protein
VASPLPSAVIPPHVTPPSKPVSIVFYPVLSITERPATYSETQPLISSPLLSAPLQPVLRTNMSADPTKVIRTSARSPSLAPPPPPSCTATASGLSLCHGTQHPFICFFICCEILLYIPQASMSPCCTRTKTRDRGARSSRPPWTATSTPSPVRAFPVAVHRSLY